MGNHFVAVGGFVTNNKNLVLLIKSPLRGWEFPGGMVESGESLPEALIREIKEESGVTVFVKNIIGIYKNIEKDILNIDFGCVFESGTLTISDESLEVGWFSPKEAAKLITDPLCKERFSNMISHNSKMFCNSFTKSPFRFTETIEFPIE